MVEVIEGDTPNLTVNFYNESDVLTAPATATWKALDVDSGQELQASVAITPIASSVQITLPSTVTTIINNSKKFEIKKVIVEATFGDGRKKFGIYNFQVQNREEA